MPSNAPIAMPADITLLETGHEGYWQQARRPLTALVFILPFLTVYEMGVLWLGPDAMRNGADAWLRQLLETIGFGQYFLLPLFVIALLLGWHHTTHQPWRVSAGVLYGMLAECVVLACGLIVLGQIQGAVFQAIVSPQANFSLSASISDLEHGVLARIIGFSGAGIYEELLFRLMLLPVAAGLLRMAGASNVASGVGAVVFTSLIFAAAHHVGPLGEELAFYPFAFRTMAGMCFSLLFVFRGFGVAAGTHAIYDIFVGVF